MRYPINKLLVYEPGCMHKWMPGAWKHLKQEVPDTIVKAAEAE